MPGFVADAAATLPWCFEDEATPATEALLERLRAGEPAIGLLETEGTFAAGIARRQSDMAFNAVVYFGESTHLCHRQLKDSDNTADSGKVFTNQGRAVLIAGWIPETV